MKTNSVDAKIKNWYQDRYVVANVQRNILLLLTILLSVGIFISLILVKYIYENKSVEPYLINVDKKTGAATIVESESVRSFTASEIIRESYVVRYVKARESFKKESEIEDKDFVRMLSSKDVYTYYTNNPKKQVFADYNDLEKMRSFKTEVAIRSIVFTSPKTVELKVVRKIIIDGNLARKKFFRLRVVFDFFDLDLPLEERYVNPFGFQVVNYDTMEEKVVEGYDPEEEDKKVEVTKQQQVSLQTDGKK